MQWTAGDIKLLFGIQQTVNIIRCSVQSAEQLNEQYYPLFNTVSGTVKLKMANVVSPSFTLL